ncbi:DUF3530 family protein [Pseudoalteromonas tunicata]|uniref:DUF3530 family protein n=1 Tax=Pseudoalteromonas tunicata TaxID=314281 RepID=UPI0003269306|nr:DUF3530 family protein [Pseudoalteromonas tunicata]ATC93672.1 hypothetical protein PTUN_a0968 [Pseudoalteromonas tunicata]
MRYLLLLIWSLNLFAAQALEIKAPDSLESIFQQDQFHYYRGDEIKMVLAGETEFATLFRDRTSAMAKGIVILMPDWQLPANNYYGLDSLRKTLNQYGWVSYAMNIPDPIAFYQQEIKADNTLFHAPDAERLDSDALNAYQLQLMSRFKAVYQTALGHPGFIIVIAQGATSTLLVDYFAKTPEEEVDALIFLSSYLPDRAKNELLNQNFAKVKPPVLDIFSTADSSLVKETLSQRKIIATREHKLNYRQRELFNSQTSPQQQARLTKEIYGFLTKSGL